MQRDTMGVLFVHIEQRSAPSLHVGLHSSTSTVLLYQSTVKYHVAIALIHQCVLHHHCLEWRTSASGIEHRQHGNTFATKSIASYKDSFGSAPPHISWENDQGRRCCHCRRDLQTRARLCLALYGKTRAG